MSNKVGGGTKCQTSLEVAPNEVGGGTKCQMKVVGQIALELIACV